MFVPVAALAHTLGAVVVATSGATIALAAASGPPQPILADAASLLIGPSDLGPGYAGGAVAPAAAAAVEPGDAAARLGVASAAFSLVGPGGRRGLPPSVGHGPATVAVTLAEYAGAPQAAAAVAAAVTALAAGGAWPGVSGPYTAAGLPIPVGQSDFFWTAGATDLLITRVDNWVMTSSARAPSLAVAWSVWLEQAHRIAFAPRPTPGVAATTSPGPAVALPQAAGPAMTLTLNGVPLGEAVWEGASGYAVPVDAVAESLDLTMVRTGATSVNLQGSGSDNGVVPPVIVPPRQVPLSPSLVWGIPYDPISGKTVTNAALAAASAAGGFAATDLGRLGGYALQYGTTSALARKAGAPVAVSVETAEFSSSAGASQAVLTYSGQLPHVMAGARPLALGDLNGGHGNGPVRAVVALQFSQGGKTLTQFEWYLMQVDNWELLVGVAGPKGSLTPRTVWPFLMAQAQNIELAAQPAP